MKPNNFFQKELISFFKNKKALIIKFLLPFIFLLPVLVANISMSIKVEIFIVMIIFLGIFSSAVGLIQLRENKMLERLAILPISTKKIIIEYLFATICFDIFKLIIPFIILIGLNSENFSINYICWLIICFISSIGVANSFGILVALISGSSGEGHLYAIITVISLCVISGIFPLILPKFLSFVQIILPFHYLSNSLLYPEAISIIEFYIIVPASLLIVLLIVVITSRNLFRFP
ncbi:MAG: ABC transporter permease [Promethearchaeota archaeon]